MLKDHCVVVAHSCNASNTHRILNPATGKELPSDYYPDKALLKGLAAWRSLPASERAASGDLPQLTGYKEPATPPPGGIILKSYTRGLLRDEERQLRRPLRYVMAGGNYGWAAEPQCDHVWLTEAEWKSLVPTEPKKGASHDVPQALSQRIATFHLLDKALGFPGFFWSKTTCTMKLTVEGVSERVIRMRLEGEGRLGEKDGGYPVFFAGFLIYDRKQEKLTRFDVVALGADGGEQRTPKERDATLNISYEVPKGCVPLLAVAFELVSGEREIDRVPPYAIMYDSAKSYNRPYFPARP